ncbi:TPA: hypothetical protein MYR17_004423 [Citrobacter koseri]|nr:hypothetical protein [Citrobacter koseri]HCR9736976.1 hypothetical protein [Citrobacter koseri]
MRTPHIVPLSRQAIAILKQIHEISGHLELVFPGDDNRKDNGFDIIKLYL